MDIKAIQNSCYTDEKEPESVTNWLQFVETLIGDQDALSLLGDTKFLCKLFTRRNAAKVSGTHYTRIKRYTKKLLEFYKLDTTIPSFQEVSQETGVIDGLFGCLNDVLDFIDKIGEAKISNYNSAIGLVRIKSIAILIWHGLTNEEISNFKKSDILASENEKLYIRVDDRLIAITPREHSILTIQAENDHVWTLNGKRYYYTVESDFLIRNRKGDQGRNKRECCTKVMTRFNESIYPWQLTYSQLYLSGKFELVLNDNSSQTIVNKIIKHTGCDDSRAYMFRDLYKTWLETYHADKII